MATIKAKMLPRLNLEKLDFSQMDWATGTEYKIGQLIFVNNNMYKCTEEHTSAAAFDQTKFFLMVKGLQVSNMDVLNAPGSMTVAIIPTELEKPYVLKQREDLTWREAVQSEEHLENTDYTISYNETLTEMTIVFHFIGKYKIFY